MIGTDPGLGLRIEEGFYRLANNLTDHLRMPLFALLAWCTYGLRPWRAGVGWSGVWRFVGGKFRRLLLPMLVVGTVFAVLQSLVPGTNDAIANWWTLHPRPVSFFWFVEALFLIFLAVLALEALGALGALGALATPLHALGVFLLSLGLFFSPVDPWVFAAGGASYLAPFFFAGMIVCRYRGRTPANGWVSLVMLIACLGLYALVDAGWLVLESRRSAVSLCIGLSGCMALLWLAPRSPSLAWLGGFSYSIYLYHVFFSAATRIGAERLGLDAVHAVFAVFAVSMLTALLLPVALDRVFDRHPLSRLWLLGRTRASGAGMGTAPPVSGGVVAKPVGS